MKFYNYQRADELGQCTLHPFHTRPCRHHWCWHPLKVWVLPIKSQSYDSSHMVSTRRHRSHSVSAVCTYSTSMETLVVYIRRRTCTTCKTFELGSSHTHTHTRTRTHTHRHARAHTHTRMHTHSHMRTHAHTHTDTHTHTLFCYIPCSRIFSSGKKIHCTRS